jgi:hypothetical protein
MTNNVVILKCFGFSDERFKKERVKKPVDLGSAFKI